METNISNTEIFIISISLIIIILLVVIFMIYKSKPVVAKSLNQIKDNDNKPNSLTDDEKSSIKEYFTKLGDYLEGFFLRKYISSFTSLNSSQLEELKSRYKDINSREVAFPLLYSDISNKNLSLAKFLKSEYSSELNNNDLLDSESLIEEIKNSKIKKKHKKILEELKKYNLDENDQINWTKLYEREPVAIVN